MSLNPVAVEPNRMIQLVMRDYNFDEDNITIQKKVGGSFTDLATLTLDSNGEGVYNDNGLATSTQYTYRIRANNSYGSSDWYQSTATSLGIQTGSKSTQVIADTWVFKGAPGYPDYANNNYGSEGYVLLQGPTTTMTGGLSAGLLQFNLPALPSYSTGYKGANLIMYDGSGGRSSYYTPIELYAGLGLNSWNENTVTYNTQPGQLLSDANGPLGHVIKYADDSSGHVVSINMDISNLASYWYTSKFPNYGANYGLSIYTSSDPQIYWAFYSKEGYQPGSAYLQVKYNW